MGVEVILIRITRDELDQMKKDGAAAVLDGPGWEEKSKSWLKLDEFILAFLSHEDPRHETLYNAVMGGGMFSESLLRDDVPRYLDPMELRALSQSLDSVTEDELRSRFEGLRHIFGGFVMGPGATDEDAFDYLHKRFLEVQRYYREAAQNQDGVVLVLY
jgi:hypothetical protein